MNIRDRTLGIAGYVSLVAPAVFLVLLVVLYFLEPEFNPPHLISEYELGRFGWLMSLAFFTLAIASLFLVRALWSDIQTRGGRVGMWWLALVGVGYIGAGIFAPNPASIVESRVHGLSGLVVILSSPIVFTLLARTLIRNRRWSNARHVLKWATMAAWIGVLVFFGSIIISYGLGHVSKTIAVGWTNRFMILTYCAWLMAVALQTIKLGKFASDEERLEGDA
jgi:Protein of unknown function (DUF998)